MASLSAMPDAIVSRILDLSVNQNRDRTAAIRLAGISRRIRSLAIDQQSLWTKLNNRMSREQFVCYISRSKELPLSLRIEVIHIGFSANRLESDISVRDELRRIQSIDVSLTAQNGRVETAVDYIRTLLRVGHLYQLRSVRLTTAQDYWSPAVDDTICLAAFNQFHFPSLYRLSVRPSSCEALRSWSHLGLTSLSLKWMETLTETFDLVLFLAFLREMVGIREIKLGLDLAPQEAIEPVHIRVVMGLSVVLPQMETLVLDIDSKCACAIFSIMSTVRMPNLQELRVLLTSYSRSEYTSLELIHFHDHVRYLSLHWPDDWASVPFLLPHAQEFPRILRIEIFEFRRVSGSLRTQPVFRAAQIISQRFSDQLPQLQLESEGFAEDVPVDYGSVQFDNTIFYRTTL